MTILVAFGFRLVVVFVWRCLLVSGLVLDDGVGLILWRGVGYWL